MAADFSPQLQAILRRGLAIPASPLALDQHRRLDERRQRALWRYYSDAGAGGIAVGVHTTQFAIRDPRFGLYEPVLALGADEFARLDRRRPERLLRIAGICGRTPQAVGEAELARALGYHAGLLSLAALDESDERTLVNHCRAVAEVIPVFGFYLQPAVGGRVLPYSFWRQFATLDNLVAIKIAPFNRYQTLDVVRAVADSGRDDIALYTGNDDNIVVDLLTTYRFPVGDRVVQKRMVGGLLGHWAVWTRRLATCSGSVTWRRSLRTCACRGPAGRDRAVAMSERVAEQSGGRDRYECRDIRCRPQLCGMYSGSPRSASPPRVPARRRVSRPAGDTQPRSGQGDRPRLSSVPGSRGRRVCAATPRSMAPRLTSDANWPVSTLISCRMSVTISAVISASRQTT